MSKQSVKQMILNEGGHTVSEIDTDKMLVNIAAFIRKNAIRNASPSFSDFLQCFEPTAKGKGQDMINRIKRNAISIEWAFYNNLIELKDEPNFSHYRLVSDFGQFAEKHLTPNGYYFGHSADDFSVIGFFKEEVQ